MEAWLISLDFIVPAEVDHQSQLCSGTKCFHFLGVRLQTQKMADISWREAWTLVLKEGKWDLAVGSRYLNFKSGLLSLMTTPICSTHHSAQMKILSTEIYRDVQGIEFVVNIDFIRFWMNLVIFGHWFCDESIPFVVNHMAPGSPWLVACQPQMQPPWGDLERRAFRCSKMFQVSARNGDRWGIPPDHCLSSVWTCLESDEPVSFDRF